MSEQVGDSRSKVLLKAALDLLRENEYFIDGTAYYDDTDCDVFCLIDDIKTELDIDNGD